MYKSTMNLPYVEAPIQNSAIRAIADWDQNVVVVTPSWPVDCDDVFEIFSPHRIYTQV